MIASLNDACETLLDCPELTTPLALINMWKRMLSDIRYLVNSSIARSNSMDFDGIRRGEFHGEVRSRDRDVDGRRDFGGVFCVSADVGVFGER